MKFKRIMLVTLVLLAILTIGAVSASDNMTSDDGMAANNVGEESIDSCQNSEVTGDGGNMPVSSDGGNSSELSDEGDGEEINLWVDTDDRFSTDEEDLGTIFANAIIPEGINGRLVFVVGEDEIYSKALEDFDSDRIDNITYNIALEDGGKFIFDGCDEVFFFRYKFLDENDDELAGQDYMAIFDEGDIFFRINAHNPGDHVSIDVAGDVDWDDENDFVWINLPSDVTEGKVVVTGGEYTLFEEEVNFDEGTHWWKEIDDHYVCSFAINCLSNLGKLNDGDIVTFAFESDSINESKQYRFSSDEDTVSFEECRFIDIEIWNEDLKGKLYLNYPNSDVVSVRVPRGYEGTIHVFINDDERADWEIEHYGEDEDSWSLQEWGLNDLGISNAGNYSVVVKLDDEVLAGEILKVYEFGNDTFMAIFNYDAEGIDLYCPEGIEATIRVTVEKEYAEDDIQNVFDEQYDAANYPGWSFWALRDLGFEHDSVWTVFTLTIANGTEELYSFNRGYSVSEGGVDEDGSFYVPDEVNINHPEDSVISIYVFPEDADGDFTIVISQNGTVVSEKSFNAYEDDKEGEFWFSVDDLGIEELGYGTYDIAVKFTSEGVEVNETYSASFRAVPVVITINDREELTDIYNYIFEIRMDNDADGSAAVYIDGVKIFEKDIKDFPLGDRPWINGYVIRLNDLNITETGQYDIRLEVFDGEGNLLRNDTEITRQINVEGSAVKIQSKTYANNWIADFYFASPLSADAKVTIYLNGTLAGEKLLFGDGYFIEYSADVYFDFNENFADEWGNLKVGDYSAVIHLIDDGKDTIMAEGEFSVNFLDVGVSIWAEDDERGLLYNDTPDVILKVDIPKCYEGTLHVLVNGNEKFAEEITFDDVVVYVSYFFVLSDLEMTEAGDYTIELKINDETVGTETVTVHEFKNDTCRALIDYEDEIIKLYIPDGSEGAVTVAVRKEADVDEGNFDEIYRDSYEISDENYGWNQWNLSDMGFEHDGRLYVFAISVTNATGEEVYRYRVSHSIDEGDDDTNPFTDYQFEFDDDGERDLAFAKSSKVLVGFFYIPLYIQPEETTLYVYRNGELFKTIASNDSATHGFFNFYRQSRGFEVWLDLTKVEDKDVLSFYLPDRKEDNMWNVSIEDLGDKLLFHDEYAPNVFEFAVFYGNTTKGRLNDPDLMSINFNGRFFILTISDSYGITEGSITISDGESVIKTITLAECEKEYDYSCLGLTYSLNLTEVLSQIPEGKNITVSFNSEYKTLSQKRIRTGDYIKKIITTDDVAGQYTFNVAGDALTNESDIAVGLIAHTNRQAIFIDLCGGYFIIYVDGVKVENAGELSFNSWATYSNWEMTDYNYLDNVYHTDDGIYPNKTAFLNWIHGYWGSELELFRLTSWYEGAEELNITLADLGITKSGTYNIRITYYPDVSDWAGDENEDPEYFVVEEVEVVNKNIAVKFEGDLKPADPALTIAVDDIDYGNNAVINISTDESFSGQVLVKIGDVQYQATVTKGTGNVTVSDFNAGEYKVNAIIEASELFNADEANATFKVNKVDSALSFEGTVLTYGESVNITVTTDGATGIIAKIGGENVDVEGNVVLISGLDAGSYGLNVTTIPDANHNAVSKVSPIWVDKAPSSVAAEDLTVGYGEAIVMAISSVNATSIDYAIIGKGGAIIKQDTVSAGSSISGITLAAGTYTVNLTTVVDDNHDVSSSTASITVNPALSSIAVEDLVVDYGDAIVMPVSSIGAISIDYVIAGKGGVVVRQDNIPADGSISGIALDVGTYTVNLTAVADENHTSVSKIASITVNKIASSLSVSNVEFDWNTTVSTFVSFDGATGVVAEVVNHTEAIVNVEGNLITVSNLNAGNYVLAVTTIADDDHRPVTKTAAVTVKKVKSTVNLTGDIAFTYGGSGTVDVSFTGASAVTAEVIDNAGKATVDGNVITVSGLDAGSYVLAVTTVADANHIAATGYANVTVNKLATKITGTKVTTTYGTSKKVYFTLKDANGNILKNTKVTVSFNGKTYTKTTGSDGKAYIALSTTLPVKSYSLTVSAISNSNYVKPTGKVSVVVNKATPKLTAASKTLRLTDKNKKYTITLKTDKNKVYKSAKVTIKVNKVTYSAKTNSKGQVTFKLTKLTKAGKFTAIVKFVGDSKYKSVTKKPKITVK